MAELARRGFIAADPALAAQPAKIPAIRPRRRRERGGVRLLAAMTMAMDDRSGQTIDLVLDRSTETASLHGSCTAPRYGVAQGKAMRPYSGNRAVEPLALQEN